MSQSTLLLRRRIPRHLFFSIRLARLLLSRLHFSINDLFLNSSALSTCHVIELG